MSRTRLYTRIIEEIVKKEVANYIFMNLKKGVKKRTCICGCRQKFPPRSRYHQFYSRSCYSRMHRIPGFVKKIIDHKD